MSANQDLRNLFRGSPLLLIFKVPLIIAVVIVYTVYSLLKFVVTQLPILFNCIFQYVSHCLSYLNHFILPRIYHVLNVISNQIIESCQKLYRCFVQPVIQIVNQFIRIQLPWLIERIINLFWINTCYLCYWLWTNCVKPLPIFFFNHLLPQIIGSMTKFIQLLPSFYETLYRLIKSSLKNMINGIQMICYRILELLFLIFISLAENLILAYRVAKSIHSQYIRPCLIYVSTLSFLLWDHTRNTALSLIDLLRQFNRFCFNAIIQPIPQLLSRLPSLTRNIIVELKRTINDVVNYMSIVFSQVHLAVRRR